jgi:hypothetical protein
VGDHPVSTWLYLECLEHDPPLQAGDESGQHLYDLPQIRADIADREGLVADWLKGASPEDYFRSNSARFLTQHTRCRIGIRDEYGREHPITAAADS